jgi:hypothetical protein
MQSNGYADLRRWDREPVVIPVSLVLKADELESDTSTATINISLSGVRVLTKLALIPKQKVAIVIEGQFTQTISARVVWVREDASNYRTIAGLKFLVYNYNAALGV